MHTEPVTERDDFTQAHQDYFAGINAILNDPDKQKRFAQLTPLPLPTTGLCDSIFQEYPRALKAHNQYIKNTFTTEEAEVDFKTYCESIGFMDFWHNQGMEALKKYINAFIVVDMPRVQSSPRPEPYMYLLHIGHVVDVCMRKDSPVCDYIVYCQDLQPGDLDAKIVRRRYIIDDYAYRMYYQTESSADWLLDYEVPHNMPECPVFKFYPQIISHKNPLNSLSPITTSLGNLDDLLTSKVDIKYYEKYGMFPIYWGYKQKCTYRDQVTGAECDGNGRTVWFDIDGADRQAKYGECPACKAKKLIGPGTFLEVDPPRMKEEHDMREPVGYIGVDVEALKFAEDKLIKQINEITYQTTGKTNVETQSKEALNEMDVKRQFESRLNVLMIIKRNLELSMYYGYRFLAIARYGDMYINTVVDLGSEFFLRSEKELNADYQETKTAGRPAYELASKREFIYLTAYQNNPDELARLNILQNIEPYQDYSIMELKTMGVPQFDPVGFLIKLNLYSLIKRFERENLPILQFGSALSFEGKINAITNTLKTYVNEYKIQPPDPKGQPEP